MKIIFSEMHKAETHRETLIKFILLLGVLLLYFAYLTFEYNLMTGGMVAAITWSFFVLCTPVADAGFLLDFPIRVIFGIRMLFSEIMVWLIAIVINVYALLATPQMYETTFLTQLLKTILQTPYPYWSIIIISSIGTFLSIHFGDEMLDVLRHKDRTVYHQHSFKLKVIGVVGTFGLIFTIYYYLIDGLNAAVN